MSYKVGERLLLANRTFVVTGVACLKDLNSTIFDRVYLSAVDNPGHTIEKQASELAIYARRDYDCDVCRDFANNFSPRDTPTEAEPNHPDCSKHEE